MIFYQLCPNKYIFIKNYFHFIIIYNNNAINSLFDSAIEFTFIYIRSFKTETLENVTN